MRLSTQHLQPRQSAGGFTLIELMVGLAVGAIVMTGVLFSWSVSVRNNGYILAVTSMNNDMRSTMHVVTQDIRRANGEINPATIAISNDGRCVAFDANWMRADETELRPLGRGYRLTNTAFEMWVPSPADLAAEDDVPMENRCTATSGAWQAVFVNGDRGVSITNFLVSADRSRCIDWIDEAILVAGEDFPSFSGTEGRCPPGSVEKVELILVDVQIAGSIEVGGESRSFVFNDSVKVRNDIAF